MESLRSRPFSEQPFFNLIEGDINLFCGTDAIPWFDETNRPGLLGFGMRRLPHNASFYLNGRICVAQGF